MALASRAAMRAARFRRINRALRSFGGATHSMRTRRFHLWISGEKFAGKRRYVALYRHRAGVYEAGERPVEHDLQHRQRKLLHRLFRRYAAGRYYGTTVERKAEKLKYSILKAHIGRKGKVYYAQSDEFRF